MGLRSPLAWRLLAASVDDAAAPVFEAYSKALDCAPLDHGYASVLHMTSHKSYAFLHISHI
jgi:hypothetical protein